MQKERIVQHTVYCCRKIAHSLNNFGGRKGKERTFQGIILEEESVIHEVNDYEERRKKVNNLFQKDTEVNKDYLGKKAYKFLKTFIQV